MYCNIDIDTECRKLLSQYQYLIRILQYFSVSVMIFIFFQTHLSPRQLRLVSSTTFPPLKSLSERAEEASGELNFMKTLLINDSCDFKNGTVKYWKYQYFSIYFLILSIDIDINELSIKQYIINMYL